jgi:hypothetical protein
MEQLSASYWHELGERTRVEAEVIRDAETKRLMHKIANGYEAMAKRIETLDSSRRDDFDGFEEQPGLRATSVRGPASGARSLCISLRSAGGAVRRHGAARRADCRRRMLAARRLLKAVQCQLCRAAGLDLWLKWPVANHRM